MKFLWVVNGALTGVYFGVAIWVVLAAIFTPYIVSDKVVFSLLCCLGVLIAGGFGIDIGLRAHHFVKQPVSGRAGWTPRKVLLTAWLFLGILVLSLGMIAASDAYSSTPPSDARMIANFHRHRAVFDTLLAMKRHDNKLIGVGADGTDPSDPETIGVPPERIADYHRLLDLANVKDGFGTLPNGGLEFSYWEIGYAFASDTGKGYAYLPQPPSRVLARLDGSVPKRIPVETSYFAYRHIEGNWYLEYDCEAE